ncbi:hypothetical protein APR11_004815 [Nocardia amikacinitolerans]|uniref:hypothetical protein n=1 Tax=Nocardia amikacinitolerans TaxID=756689 RepID=UPI0020A4FD49|nr:hypothetical protein [Nocardia amikacinitolerans]MCP2298370.1 hypothetical protein [Nocardia amikacinitolerans]
MSKKKNATTAPTAPAAPAPETTAPAPEAGSGVAVVPVLRNDTDRALWAELGNHPGSTTAALADTAGIGVSTARRLLTGWETAGAARSATDTTSPRAAKTWTAGSAAPEPAAPAEEAAPADRVPDITPETTVAAPTGDDPATPAPVAPAPADDAAAANAESTVERLPAGALRGQVEDFLRDHPGEEFTPHQIGKALDRSSGAVHNALVTLTKHGTARQTSTAPKKFTLAS